MSVEGASWIGMVPGGASQRFRPTNDTNNAPRDFDYVEEEWFVRGEQEHGPYATVVLVRRPRDPARFSGIILVEPLRIQQLIVAMSAYTAAYIMRSGHGWAMVVSQQLALDDDVKPVNPVRYASLGIAAEPVPPGAVDLRVGQPTDPAMNPAFFAELLRYRPSSSGILAQVGAALRAPDGPFGECSPQHVILMGHSQTGKVTADFLLNDHVRHRLADGSPVYDGYFPSGLPSHRLSTPEVPVVQVLSEGDVVHLDGIGSLPKGAYRRDDSDEPDDRYRLYELAGHAHSGTRYPPTNDAEVWRQFAGMADSIAEGATMSSLPTFELFRMALHHLVQWVTEGVTPPRADRLERGPDGRLVRDEFGHARGGARCVQLDVPRARHTIVRGVAVEEPFDEATMQRLYGDHAGYVARFDERLDELIGAGFFLEEDAPGLRDEAAKAIF